MGFLRNPIPFAPSQFTPPPMITAPEYNPIAAAQAAAQQQAQDSMKMPGGGGAGGMQQSPIVGKEAIAPGTMGKAGGGGMMGSINGLFGGQGGGGINPAMLAQLMSFL